MLTQKGLKNDGASRASILMKTGACVGGTSTYLMTVYHCLLQFVLTVACQSLVTSLSSWVAVARLSLLPVGAITRSNLTSTDIHCEQWLVCASSQHGSFLGAKVHFQPQVS